MLHLIVYISDYAKAPEEAAEIAKNIVRISKKANPQHGITGVLFFHDNKFLQVIEGDEDALRQLMHNIEDDERHTNVQYLIDTPVEKRGFQSWNMDFFHLGAGRVFDAETMRRLTRDFAQTLLPRSDTLTVYYKIMLEQGVRKNGA